ncbi:MAG: TusE/DsrC/DsvC family sulfur relay protein [Gammaproteobacteria bacterium]
MLNEWNETIARQIAESENITLNENHWKIIHFLRELYAEYELIPPMRIFVKKVAERFDSYLGNTILLQTLFPGGALKQSCKIAGLPIPRHCL